MEFDSVTLEFDSVTLEFESVMFEFHPVPLEFHLIVMLELRGILIIGNTFSFAQFLRVKFLDK